jgi:arylsulfatase A-like enzyme
LRGHEGDIPFSRLNDVVAKVNSDRRKTRVNIKQRDDAPTLADLHAHTNFRQRYEEESHIGKVADVACRWVEDNYRGGPFFFWLDCFDVHEPWFPPEYLWRMYQPVYDGEPMVHPNDHSAEVYASDELRNMQARYAAMCTLASKHIGRVLRVVEDTGLLENTVVCFLSDHGIYLGERGRTGKSLITADEFDTFPFYRELTDVCWSMHLPPSLGKFVPAGTSLPQVVQAPDLMPTLLDLCGVPVPDNAAIEGASLTPLLRGESNAAPRDISISTWSIHSPRENAMLYCRRPTVTDGEWTLFLSEPPLPAPPLLYHIVSDPNQEHDVMAQHRPEAQRLHRTMLEWLRLHEANAATLERLSAPNVGLE